MKKPVFKTLFFSVIALSLLGQSAQLQASAFQKFSRASKTFLPKVAPIYLKTIWKIGVKKYKGQELTNAEEQEWQRVQNAVGLLAAAALLVSVGYYLKKPNQEVVDNLQSTTDKKKVADGPQPTLEEQRVSERLAREKELEKLEEKEGSLLEAVAERKHDLAKRLIDLGASRYDKSLMNDTPLHIAARNQDVEMVKILLQIPMSLSENIDDKTEIDVAKATGNQAIITLVNEGTR